MRPTRDPASRDDSRGTLLRPVIAIPLLVVGLVLVAFATLTQAELVDQEVFQGMAPPGQMLIPVNQTGYGAVTFRAIRLPCPLFIYPLSPLDYAEYRDEGDLPFQSLNCDAPNATAPNQVSHLLLRNVDPTDPKNYSVEARFFRLTQPHLWLVFPAAGLLLLGTAIVIMRLLERGLGRMVEQMESRGRDKK